MHSRYENGDPWMRLEVDQAIQEGYLRPAQDLKPAVVENEDEFKKGFIFEKEPEVLTRGHLAAENHDQLYSKRVEKIAERAALSNYGKLLPTRRNDFPVTLITFRDFRKQANHFGNDGGVPVVNEENQNSILLYLLDLGPVPNPVLPPSDAPRSHFPRGIVSNKPVPILVKCVAWSPAPNLVLLTPCDVTARVYKLQIFARN